MVTIADITRLLDDAYAERPGALDELMRVVYEDLEQVAANHLHRHFGGRVNSITLEPAALVNESLLKLIHHRQKYDNRGHFFSIATKVMLNVLLDYCRRRNAQKRGGDRTRISFSMAADQVNTSDRSDAVHVELEPLARALETLDQLDQRKADVVQMRVIWGMTNEQIAASLGVSRPTVERDWRFAKAWLAEEISALRASEPDGS
jgi:RNA polymerase sigma factor (TIGR02999 family)